MRGLTLQVTNTTNRSISVVDLSGRVHIPAGGTVELLYTSEVQQSLEYGSLNGFLIKGTLTAKFSSGTLLNRSPVGATVTGAGATTDGERGLVPKPQAGDREKFLKGDGSWSGVTAESVGAIQASLLTTPGDTLARGPTAPVRVPHGTVGQAYRQGTTVPSWQDVALSGLHVHRPLAGASYAGVLYWSTDEPSGSQLSICYFNGGGYDWLVLGTGGGGGGNTNTVAIEFDHTTSSPLVVGTVTAGERVIRALVVVGVAWDGGSPTVEFGTAGSTSSLLGPLDVDLTYPAQYESGQIHKFTTGDNLVLTIASSGSTTGTGTLVFTTVG